MKRTTERPPEYYNELINRLVPILESAPRDLERWREIISVASLVEGSGLVQELADSLPERYPEIASAWRFRSVVLCNQKRLPESEHAARRAIELGSQDADNWLTLALCLMKSGQTSEAITCFLRALELEPRNYHAWMALSLAYVQMGNHQSCKDALRKAVRLDPPRAKEFLKDINAMEEKP